MIIVTIMIMTIMMKMTIRITRVKTMTGMVMTDRIPTTGSVRPIGSGKIVHAELDVHVPELNARAVIV